MIIFEDLIGDMFSNKKTFCTKNVKLCFNQNFIMKIAHKREFQQIAINDSLLIDFKEFMNLWKNVLETILFCSQWYYSCMRQSFVF